MKSPRYRMITIVLVLSAVLSFSACSGNKTTLNGVDIGSYTIVYDANEPDYNLRAAQYIQKEILARTGKEIPIQGCETGDYKHQIIVGETDRALSKQLDAETEKLEFSLLADENHVAMEGNYFVIAAAAYYFVNTYIGQAAFESTVPMEATVHTPITEKSNNVIFLIGDGMGVYQTKMFEYMMDSAMVQTDEHDGEDVFYGYYLPYIGSVHTNSFSGITDSAAGATALACGYKTVNSYVGRDKDLKDVQSLTELAASLGKATAVMSTDLQTGATPAGFSAHADDRDDSTKILKDQVKLMQEHGTLIYCGLHSSYGYQDTITDVLEELEQSENGFFLMYEEGYIDKFCHSQDAYGAFECMLRFNQAIGLFMEHSFYHPDTLVLITADHETGGLGFNDSGEPVFNHDGHTPADVPIFAYGQGAEVFADFADDNTRIPKELAKLWGIEDFGDPNGFSLN